MGEGPGSIRVIALRFVSSSVHRIPYKASGSFFDLGRWVAIGFQQGTSSDAVVVEQIRSFGHMGMFGRRRTEKFFWQILNAPWDGLILN